MNRRVAGLGMFVFALAVCSIAYAGRPITKEMDGFVKDVTFIGEGTLMLHSEGIDYSIPMDKTLTVKSKGKSITREEVKVGSKAHMNQLKQDDKIVYTMVDLS